MCLAVSLAWSFATSASSPGQSCICNRHIVWSLTSAAMRSSWMRASAESAEEPLPMASKSNATLVASNRRPAGEPEGAAPGVSNPPCVPPPLPHVLTKRARANPQPPFKLVIVEPRCSGPLSSRVALRFVNERPAVADVAALTVSLSRRAAEGASLSKLSFNSSPMLLRRLAFVPTTTSFSSKLVTLMKTEPTAARVGGAHTFR